MLDSFVFSGLFPLEGGAAYIYLLSALIFYTAIFFCHTATKSTLQMLDRVQYGPWGHILYNGSMLVVPFLFLGTPSETSSVVISRMNFSFTICLRPYFPRAPTNQYHVPWHSIGPSSLTLLYFFDPVLSSLNSPVKTVSHLPSGVLSTFLSLLITLTALEFSVMTHFKVLYAGVLYMWCTFFFLQSKLHHGFSIFTAIFCSTSYVSTLHGHFLILTDFLSSVSALSSSHTTSHYFVTRIPSLLSELPMNNVIGQWVHIHMGIPGNELIADGMAKRSLELSYITQVPFPADSIRRRLTTYYRALWQSHQLGLNLFSLSCLNFYCPISSPPLNLSLHVKNKSLLRAYIYVPVFELAFTCLRKQLI